MTRQRRHTNPGQIKKERERAKRRPLSRDGEAVLQILPRAPTGLGANSGVNGLRSSSNTHLSYGGKNDPGMPLGWGLCVLFPGER